MKLIRKHKNLDLISIQVFKDMTSSSLLRFIDEDKIPPSFNLNDAIKVASEPINYLCRYPKVILQKLLDNELIDYKTYCQWKYIFDKHRIDVRKFNNREIQCPDGYIRIKGQSRYIPYTLFEDIKIQMEGSFSKKPLEIFIPKESFEKFLSIFHLFKEIDWSDLSRQTNLPWSTDLIIKYNFLWDWYELERNPTIDFNFDLIEQGANFINWNLFPFYCFDKLKWTASEIRKFSKHIISDHSSFMKGGSNFSYFLNVEKKKDILDELIDFLNWDSLSANTNIQWDLPLIKHFENRLNFIRLSANKSILWTEELIEKYEHIWDWELLSDNPALPWTLELINKFEHKFNWKFLSGNKNLPWSKSFISLYESRWTWKPSKESVCKYFDKRKFNNEYPSISTNIGISWNEEMLSKWENEIDFYCIISYGRFDNLVFSHFRHKFDELRVKGSDFIKYKDSWEEIDTYESGWESLNKNKNFYITELNVEFLYAHKCELKILIGCDYYEGRYRIENRRTLEVLNNCKVKDIKLSDLISNEFRWTRILLNEKFINDSIWEEIIRPIFTKKFTLKYLNRLSVLEIFSK